MICVSGFSQSSADTWRCSPLRKLRAQLLLKEALSASVGVASERLSVVTLPMGVAADHPAIRNAVLRSEASGA